LSESKYSKETLARWEAEYLGGKSVMAIARAESMTKGQMTGVFFRIRRRQKRQNINPLIIRDKFGQKLVSRVTVPEPGSYKVSGRPDMLRPEIDGPDIAELKPGQCKFPVSHDRPYKFCGKATSDDRSKYCIYHTELARAPDA